MTLAPPPSASHLHQEDIEPLFSSTLRPRARVMKQARDGCAAGIHVTPDIDRDGVHIVIARRAPLPAPGQAAITAIELCNECVGISSRRCGARREVGEGVIRGGGWSVRFSGLVFFRGDLDEGDG